VHPDYQRQGLGLHLLQELQRQGIESDEIAQCNSQETWLACNAFLEHYGFVVEQRERLMRIERPKATAEANCPSAVDLSIRHALPGDDKQWAALHRQAYRERDDFSELTKGDLNQARAAPGFALLVAKGDQEIAGYCHVTHLDSSEGLINSLVVREDMQGRGIGRVLLARAKEKLWADSVATISLNVISSNATAIRLYEEAGFQRYDELLRYQRKTRAP
jgi:mycothiol synthase